MKKAIVALMMIMCAATLFAASWSQTIVLVSVVEEVRPHFGLEVAYVENGYAVGSGNEVSIHSLDIKKDTHAEINVRQGLSRFRGEMEVRISVSELCCEGNHTSGLRISANGTDTEGRLSRTIINGNVCILNFFYSGKTLEESTVANISVDYRGNENLPNGDYISYITMSYEVK